jgi:hypothetical protein
MHDWVGPNPVTPMIDAYEPVPDWPRTGRNTARLRRYFTLRSEQERRPHSTDCSRLVAKSAYWVMTAMMAQRFLSIQLGFGVPRATETAAYATCQYIADLQSEHGFSKLDVSSAFNTIRREAIFDAFRHAGVARTLLICLHML